jgi:hypothetical protein
LKLLEHFFFKGDDLDMIRHQIDDWIQNYYDSDVKIEIVSHQIAITDFRDSKLYVISVFYYVDDPNVKED